MHVRNARHVDVKAFDLGVGVGFGFGVCVGVGFGFGLTLCFTFGFTAGFGFALGDAVCTVGFGTPATTCFVALVSVPATATDCRESQARTDPRGFRSSRIPERAETIPTQC